jgi:uncharacterized membrane protein
MDGSALRDLTIMMLLVMGLVIFLAAHLIPTQPEVRASLIERLGPGSYKLIMSVVSLIGLVILVLGWQKLGLQPSKNPILWDPPLAMRHVAMLLMWPASVFLVAAYVPSRIRTALRHPMLVAVKIWALAHLLANGDLASLIVFGSFLGYAVYDRISLKHRNATGPLGSQTGGLVNDLAVVAVGTLLYLGIVFWAHEAVIGVAPYA